MNEIEKPYRATTTLCEQIKVEGKLVSLDMNIVFGYFNTEEEALKISKAAQSVTYSSSDRAILVREENTQINTIYYVYDEDVEYLTLKKEKELIMGEQIDVSKDGSVEKIIEIIETNDMNYIITEEDLEKIDFDMNKVHENFRDGFEFQNICYGSIDIREL
jgi:hypothetical protein